VPQDDDTAPTPVPETPQEALAALAQGEGATVDRLASGEGRALLDMAALPPEWPRDVQAGIMRNVLQEVVDSLRDAQHRETVRAQLGLTAEYSHPSPARRMDALLASGMLDPHKSQAYGQGLSDIGGAVAQMIVDRLSQLNASGDWEQYAQGYVLPGEAPQKYPLRFLNYHMLFTLAGRIGIECTTYRVIRALENGVDSYKAVLWYYSDPKANVEILPVANCRVGTIRPLDRGGYEATLELPHALRKGETCFFASKVLFHSTHESARIVSHEVRCQAVNRLTIGIQFDTAAPPSAVWHYTGGPKVGMTRPSNEPRDFLTVSSLGFVSHEFSRCRNGHRYGIQWDWQPLRKFGPRAGNKGGG
jgi:hypothetical protein